MILRPRHYVLLAVVIGIFIFNIIRNRHRVPAVQPPPAPIVHTGPPPQSAGWSAFDAAAALRDAPDPQYLPALKTLQSTLPTDPNAADINGCLTWLEFYRRGMAHTATDPEGKQRSQRHLEGCTRYHLDTSLYSAPAHRCNAGNSGISRSEAYAASGSQLMGGSRHAHGLLPQRCAPHQLSRLVRFSRQEGWSGTEREPETSARATSLAESLAPVHLRECFQKPPS
jgi:hypothetical protein